MALSSLSYNGLSLFLPDIKPASLGQVPYSIAVKLLTLCINNNCGFGYRPNRSVDLAIRRVMHYRDRTKFYLKQKGVLNLLG